MDAISYSYADKAQKRIKKFIENPDSTSGVVTVPTTIAAGETITIPAGRMAVLPDLQIDGDLVVDGEVFIPNGTSLSKVVEKVTSTDNAIVRFDGTTGAVQNSGVIIDDNNNVGVGTSSPKDKIHSTGGIIATGAYSGITNGGSTIMGYSGGIGYVYALDPAVSWKPMELGALSFDIKTSGISRMVLAASGKLIFGSNTFGGRISITGDSALYGDSHIVFKNNPTTNYGELIFLNAAGTQVGYIQASQTATAYVTSSDYRLKEDLKPMENSIDRLMQLKPCNFKWKETGTRVDGFIAHELQEVTPEVVTGHKDAMKEEEYEVSPKVDATYDEEGNELTPAVDAVIGKREVPDYQGIDQSKLVPLLTASLQDAVRMIENLKSRIEILEGAK